MKTFKIVDHVGKHNIIKIQAKNGKSALKEFLRTHMLYTGIYEITKEENYHLVSSYGSDFEAVPIEEQVHEMLKYKATVMENGNMYSKTFNLLSDAASWLDSIVSKVKCMSMIEIFSCDGHKIEGFFYSQ